MPPAARSSSTSATAGARSPTRSPTRPPASPTPTAPRSRPSRSSATPPSSARTCRWTDPAIYPVSGGSEAIETALKLARATQLARGEPDRWIVFARWGSYHGNTLGALDLSGRRPLRRPYEGWLGRFRHVSAAYPYRGDDAGSQALGTTQALVDELDQAITTAGPGTVAAFVAEPIVGATLGAVEPPDGLLAGDRRRLPPPRRAAHRRRGHDGLRADRHLVRRWTTTGSARTCSSRPRARPPGYWPFGFVAASGEVYDAVTGARRFVHGFTYSHQPAAAAVAREVLRILEAESLVEASATKGERLRALLRERLDGHAAVGDIRGRGLLVGVELVRDRETREPYPRAARLAETVVRTARERGLLLYSGTGNANGVDGDTILLGPPFVITDDELVRIADGLARRDRPRRGLDRGGRAGLRHPFRGSTPYRHPHGR